MFLHSSRTSAEEKEKLKRIKLFSRLSVRDIYDDDDDDSDVVIAEGVNTFLTFHCSVLSLQRLVTSHITHQDPSIPVEEKSNPIHGITTNLASWMRLDHRALCPCCAFMGK